MNASPEGAAPRFRTRNEWRAARRSYSVPRALGLTTLSALVPGLGLLWTRRRALGAIMLAAMVVCLVVIAGYGLVNGLRSTALETAGDIALLKVIAGVLVGGTVIWIAAVAATALLSRPRRTTALQRGGLGVFTLLLCLVVTGPAVLGVRYISAHVDALEKVFADEVSEDGSQPTSALSDDPEDPWADLPRVNMLILGSDAAEAREGTRTDTMMVASVDTRTGDSVLFSIPRNLQNVPIPRSLPLHEAYPNGYNCGDECLMNGVWNAADAHAEENPELYRDDANPGATATREVLATALGLDIHHAVIVNLEGFTELVDAMGGVLLNVQERIPINARTFTDWEGNLQLDPASEPEWLETGPQRLTGSQALGFARSRVTTDDFDRMSRQRCVVAAVVDQVNPLTMLQRYPQIIAAVGDNVVTDIPRADMDEWAELVLSMQQGTMRSLSFTPANTDILDPDFSDIRMRVYDALYATPAPEPPADVEAEARAEPTAEQAEPEEQAEPDPPATEDAPEESTDEALEDVGAVC